MKKAFFIGLFFIFSVGITNAGYYYVSTKTYSVNSLLNKCGVGEYASTQTTSVVALPSAPTSGSFYCIKQDISNPTGVTSYSTTSVTNTNVSVSIVCSDVGSGCNMYAISGWTISGNTYSRTFTANTSGSISLKDNVGNTTSIPYSITNIDKTVPVGNILYSITNQTNNDVNVSITCSDNVSCSMYAIAGWIVSGNTYSKTFTANTSGSINLKDTAGNITNIPYSITNIDKSYPVGNILYSITNPTNNDVSVSITCSDNVSCDMYAITGWTISGNTYSRTFTANTSGSINLKDTTGNITNVPYLINNIDKSNPIGDVLYSTLSGTNSDVEVDITCSDNVVCDMYAIAGWTISGNTYSRTFPSNASGSINLRDSAGNTTNISYLINNIDKTEPVGNISYSSESWTNNDVVVDIDCSDNTSCDMYPISGWTISGNTYSRTFSLNSSGSIDLKDSIGNITTIPYSITKIDKIKPELSDISGNGIVKSGTDIQANENENFSISVSNNLGSPITTIEGYFENKDNESSPSEIITKGDFLSSAVSNMIVERDISLTDNGFREYTFMITKICDQATNCTNNIALLNYNVVGDAELINTYTGEIIEGKYSATIKGNYNGIFLETSTSLMDYIYAIPSIITTDTSLVGLTDISITKNFVYDEYSNIPSSYDGNLSSTGLVDYNPSDSLLFKRTHRSYYNSNELVIILKNIRKLYKNSIFSITEGFLEILYSDDVITILQGISNELNGTPLYKSFDAKSNLWSLEDSNCSKADKVIGDQIWAGCNSTLGNGTTYDSEKCYNYFGGQIECSNISSNKKESDFIIGQSSNIFGKRYTGNNIHTACPTGWHVSTDEDWQELEKMIGCTDSGSLGWVCEKLGWRNHLTNLGSLPDLLGLPLSGLVNSSKLDLVGNTGIYWTSTKNPGNINQNITREFYYNSEKIQRNYKNVSDAYSVRCVKD